MRITREGDQRGARLCHAGIKPLARRRIAVPGVEVPRQAQRRERQEGDDFRTVLRGDLFGRHDLGEIRQLVLGHDHLVGQHLPGRARLDRGFQLRCQPGFLLGAQHRA